MTLLQKDFQKKHDVRWGEGEYSLWPPCQHTVQAFEELWIHAFHYLYHSLRAWTKTCTYDQVTG